MVSTDDNEIAEIAKKYGAEVPFMRSEATANDFATTRDVLVEVVEEYKKRGKVFDNVGCIYPCVPFLTAEILKEAYDKFLTSGAGILLPVVRFSFPIQRALRINEKGFGEFREPQYALTRSQDLEPMYHDVGMFSFLKDTYFVENETASQKTVLFEMNESVIQDIDTVDDWAMAELKYKIKYGM